MIVEERVVIGLVIGGQDDVLQRIVIDGDGRVEHQPVRLGVEIGDGDAVAEDIMDAAQRGWLRRDVQPLRQHADIVTVARTQHDPVFAERHRAVVAILGLVMNRQQGHLIQAD